MALSAHRARPTAKARLPFARPRAAAWRSGQPRLRIGAMIGGVIATALAGAVAWTWRRSLPLPSGPREVPALAGQAIAATGKTTVAGYRRAPIEEQVGFGLSVSFAASTVASRAINYWREQRKPVHAFKNVKGGELSRPSLSPWHRSRIRFRHGGHGDSPRSLACVARDSARGGHRSDARRGGDPARARRRLLEQRAASDPHAVERAHRSAGSRVPVLGPRGPTHHFIVAADRSARE